MIDSDGLGGTDTRPPIRYISLRIVVMSSLLNASIIGTSVGFRNAFPANLSGHYSHQSTFFFLSFFRGDYFSTRRESATVLKF